MWGGHTFADRGPSARGNIGQDPEIISILPLENKREMDCKLPGHLWRKEGYTWLSNSDCFDYLF